MTTQQTDITISVQDDRVVADIATYGRAVCTLANLATWTTGSALDRLKEGIGPDNPDRVDWFGRLASESDIGALAVRIAAGDITSDWALATEADFSDASYEVDELDGPRCVICESWGPYETSNGKPICGSCLDVEQAIAKLNRLVATLNEDAEAYAEVNRSRDNVAGCVVPHLQGPFSVGHDAVWHRSTAQAYARAACGADIVLRSWRIEGPINDVCGHCFPR